MSSAPSPSAALTDSLIIKPRSYVDRLSPGELFAMAAGQPVEVELGSGDGGFLAQWAAANPDRNFLGVERLLGRLRKLDRKGRRLGLDNLRLMRIEAGYLVRYLLPERWVNCLHLYFPDPWPKRKHRGNRLINPDFAAAVRRVLADQGTVCLRTDDADYFGQMVEVFSSTPGFRAVPTPKPLASVLTDFERDFHARGIATRHAAFQAA